MTLSLILRLYHDRSTNLELELIYIDVIQNLLLMLTYDDLHLTYTRVTLIIMVRFYIEQVGVSRYSDVGK